MFQFPGFPSMRYGLAHGWRGFAPAGFPHSDIRGSMDICSSPRLFAACHVFLRLLVPRHPPCALISLTDSAAPARHSVAWLVALSCLAFRRLPPPSGFSFLRHALACLWMSDESYLYDFLFSMQFSRYCMWLPATNAARNLMETERFELSTPCLQGRCSPN